MIKNFEFFFDFTSPYTFIAHKKIRKIEKDRSIKIKYMAILLGALLKNAGISKTSSSTLLWLVSNEEDPFVFSESSELNKPGVSSSSKSKFSNPFESEDLVSFSCLVILHKILELVRI